MHSWEGDPRPEPVPEYGTIRPGSSLKLDQSIDPQSGSWRVLFAVAAGILLAGFFATGNARATFAEITRFLTLQGKPEPASPAMLSEHEIESLDRQTPQQQAEVLLERAINHYEGANDQIATRVEGWWGKLKFTPEFNSLITTALNSNDLRVRAAGIELDLGGDGSHQVAGHGGAFGTAGTKRADVAKGLGAVGTGPARQPRRRAATRE